MPEINFNLFEDGNAHALEDLDALVDGVKMARRYAAFGEPGPAEWEISPGPSIISDDELRQYIKRDAWGHHASCTNKIGALNDPNTVVDSRFRVLGVSGLRIVDASVFPKTPGLFLALPIYMIAEKASDCIADDAA